MNTNRVGDNLRLTITLAGMTVKEQRSRLNGLIIQTIYTRYLTQAQSMSLETK